MAITERANGTAARPPLGEDGSERRYNVLVALNYEQMAAAEGWRSAHGIADQAEALGELIRLGLLSEIAKIYRLVSENREPGRSRGRGKSQSGTDPKPRPS